VCNDGSIFVDRDGEHFGHVLEYMRDGVVAVAAPGSRPNVALLRALKREFGFFCIELVVAPEPEYALVIGGCGMDGRLRSTERYDVLSGQWSMVAAMSTERTHFGTCVVSTGDVYVTGDVDGNVGRLSRVEKYSPSSDTWSTVAPMPRTRCRHVAVAIEQTIYVLSGKLKRGRHTRSTIMFHTTQGAWNKVALMPRVCDSLAACAVGKNIYVFSRSNYVFKYDTIANKWSTLAPMPFAYANHSAATVGHLMYIVGAGRSRREVLCFDLKSGKWDAVARTVRDRRYGSALVLGGCLYARLLSLLLIWSASTT
jgi:hypothetical protein